MDRPLRHLRRRHSHGVGQIVLVDFQAPPGSGHAVVAGVFDIEELAPGDSVTVMVGSGGGTLVVLDYLPGAYEAGRFVVIEVLPSE